MTSEKRSKWSKGRRWGDANRAAVILIYGVCAIMGFAMGGIVGFIVGRCTLGN